MDIAAIHQMLDEFERNGTLSASVIAAMRAHLELIEHADPDADQDALSASVAELFRQLAHQYEDGKQGDVAQELRQLANETARDAH